MVHDPFSAVAVVRGAEGPDRPYLEEQKNQEQLIDNSQ